MVCSQRLFAASTTTEAIVSPGASGIDKVCDSVYGGALYSMLVALPAMPTSVPLTPTPSMSNGKLCNGRTFNSPDVIVEEPCIVCNSASSPDLTVQSH